MHNNRDWPDSIAGRISPHDFPFAPNNTNAYQLALDLAPYPILLSTLEGLTLTWGNAAAASFLQVDRGNFGEFVLADFVPERELPSFWQSIADLQKGVQTSASTLISAEDGVGICKVTLAKSQQHLFAIGQNLPADDANAIQTDALTGLPDRRVLQKRVEAALLRECHGWGLLFVDLNNYKQVNDQYGHVAGDRVLAEFARKLEVSSRPSDLVVRYGGDEFVVFVDRIPSEKELQAMAARVAREVTVLVEDERDSIRVGCSVGCAMANPSITTVEQIISAADRDMYRRKRSKSE